MGTGIKLYDVRKLEQKYLDTRDGVKHYVNLVQCDDINKPFVVFIQKGAETPSEMQTTFAVFSFATLTDATELYDSIDDFKGCGA